MNLKNYTSTVDADRTIFNIERLLVEHKATGIAKRYDGGEVVAIEFSIKTGDGKDAHFALPVDVEAAFKVLKASRKKLPSNLVAFKAQARRTAWKLMQDWIEVQLSMVMLNQADLVQVFLPYGILEGGKTVYATIKAGNFAALEYRGEAKS